MQNPSATQPSRASFDSFLDEERSAADESLAEYLRSERINNYLEAAIFAAMVVTLTVVLFYARF
jgi:hypothetical protein